MRGAGYRQIEAEMSSGCHNGHRERMRERFFREESFASFADHELLEMRLGATIARKNTNEIAHRLLERFGSLRNILEASVDELQAVDGVGPIVATDLKLTEELVRRYIGDIFAPTKKCDTISEILKFLYPKFVGQKKECVYLLMLDNSLRLIDYRLVSTGTVNQSNVPTTKMVEIAYDKKIPNVIVAHNHPQGVATPSSLDRTVTDRLFAAFSIMGINLVEHLVFSENAFFPILKQFPHRTAEQIEKDTLRSDVREKFYDVDETTFTFSELFEQEQKKNS